jgi:alpha-tubulin suppressor-like RCC1 family protein
MPRFGQLGTSENSNQHTVPAALFEYGTVTYIACGCCFSIVVTSNSLFDCFLTNKMAKLSTRLDLI